MKKTIALSTNIDLEIGDKTFSIQVRRANSKDEQTLEAFLKKEKAKAKDADSARKKKAKKLKKIKQLQEELSDNKELSVMEEERSEKRALIVERKALRKEIKVLEDEVESYEEQDVSIMIKSFDAVPKKQFDLLVGGEGKDALVSLLDTYPNISYTDLWAVINEAVAEAHKAK